MTPASRVLIVDHTPETREVLRSLVERSGAIAVEAGHPRDALAIAERAAPDLILLDCDSDRTADHEATAKLRSVAGRTDTPIVVLGAPEHRSDLFEGGQIVPKPYHYAPLIRKIEGVLAARRVA
ncbi:MAG: response regulator [Planctomycetota bacterium]